MTWCRSFVVIRATGLVKRYGDLTAVDGIDLEVHEGEVFGLLGPNGAGKTRTTVAAADTQPETERLSPLLGDAEHVIPASLPWTAGSCLSRGST